MFLFLSLTTGGEGISARNIDVGSLGSVSSPLCVCENWKWYAVKHNYIICLLDCASS